MDFITCGVGIFSDNSLVVKHANFLFGVEGRLFNNLGLLWTVLEV